MLITFLQQKFYSRATASYMYSHNFIVFVSRVDNTYYSRVQDIADLLTQDYSLPLTFVLFLSGHQSAETVLDSLETSHVLRGEGEKNVLWLYDCPRMLTLASPIDQIAAVMWSTVVCHHLLLHFVRDYTMIDCSVKTSPRSYLSYLYTGSNP